MSINQFIIDGNVTRDPELRYTTGGTPCVTYTVATNDRYRKDDGWHERTDYIPVTTYGAQAEADSKYLKKGSGVTVMGRVRSWFDREAKKGGFHFEADRVVYRDQRGRRDAEPRGDEGHSQGSNQGGSQGADDWAADYERGGQDAAPAAPAAKTARRRSANAG